MPYPWFIRVCSCMANSIWGLSFLQDKEFCSLLIQFPFLLYLYPLPFYLFFEFLFCRQIKHVFGRKNLVAVIEQAIFYNGLVFFGTQDKPDCRIIGFLPHLVLKIAYI